MRTKIKAKIIIVILSVFLVSSLIIFIQAVFDVGDFHNLKTAAFFYLLGKSAGLIGFLFLALLIFSGDTARFFDRFFGIDKIIKFQRQFALSTMIFVLAHPIFFILSGQSIRPYIIPDFSVLPLALGIISLYIFIIVMIASYGYKRISYPIWQLIHIFTYLLFFFSLYHVFNWGSDSGNLPVRIIYFTSLVAIIAGIIYRTYYKLRQARAGKFYVQEIKNEAKGAFTLILKPDKAFLFKAGQFCFLRLKKGKLYARHPFSLSGSPQEDGLCFTVKLAGRFTKALAELKKGEEVMVDGPFGIFTIADGERRDLVFIAGGAGIAPFMSMIKDSVENSRTQNIVLLYGSRTAEDIIHRAELDQIKKDWFQKAYVLSDCHSFAEAGGCEIGFINEEIIKKYVKNISDSLFYICGPELMKNKVKETLRKLGVKKRDIMIEDFFW